MPADPRYWAVIPAAGIGTRMEMTTPKQYLSLQGRPIMEHVLLRFCRHPDIAGIVVALAPEDPHWKTLSVAGHEKISTTTGGVERCHSVLNGLRALPAVADANDWVMVHDAARPCVRREDIDALLEQLVDHPVGGLLGIPVADTMKRTDRDGNIIETVQRKGLWRALTPQMFRYEQLLQALQAALDQDKLVTDEAAAMEISGHMPRMVEGHADNIKITRPQDLVLAELFLRQQENA